MLQIVTQNRPEHCAIRRASARTLIIMAALAFLSAFLMLVCLCAPVVAAQDQEAGSYRLGPEDVITVTVARHPEFSGEFFIPADGVLNLPAAGQVQAAGKTLAEVSASVTERLSERLRKPDVAVALKSPRMQRVYVLGSVAAPGLYDVKPDWGIAEAVATAGGLPAGVEASDCRVAITRPGSASISIDLARALQGDSAANVRVLSGDTINVEAVELVPVYVTGKVKVPGLHRLRKDSAGVLQALTVAGGATDEAALSHVTVTRLSGSIEVVDLTPALVDGKQSPALKLDAGDLVVVPETTARVAVLGYVNQPGFFTLKDGQKLTLSEALGLAKGADNKRAGMTSVAIVRTDNGIRHRQTYNLAKFLKSGDTTQNPEIKPGDIVYVPETRKPDWEIVMRSLSSIGILINPFMR